MASTQKHHHELTNGVGKCSVPMWCAGMPAGFCDQPAYGKPTPDSSIYQGYVPGLACPRHGGPEPTIVSDDEVTRLRAEVERLERRLERELSLLAAPCRIIKCHYPALQEEAKLSYELQSQLTAARAEGERLRALLRELHAQVEGECPSLLNEDSGGDAKLDSEIRAALSTGTGEKEG